MTRTVTVTFASLLRPAAGAAVLALAVLARPADAATQILGVVAALDPVPMTCAEGMCTAQLSAFCLQKERDAPGYGIRYRVQAPEALELHVTDASGGVRTRAVGHDVVIMTERGFASVTVSLPESAVAELGGGEPRLRVSHDVSVLPVPVAGDPDPLGAAEVAYVTGPLRALAGRIEAQEGRRTVAAQVTNRLINALPATRRMTATQRSDLWDTAMASSRLAADDPGVVRARDIYGACAKLTGQGNTYFLKRCLEARHDDLMHTVNQRYWERAAAGF